MFERTLTPRHCRALIALLSGTFVACRDVPAGIDGAGPPVDATGPLRIVVAPATATVTQVGVDLTVSLRDGGVLLLDRFVVDSGTADGRDETWPFSEPTSFTKDGGHSRELVAWIVPRLATSVAGPHRITVYAKDASGRIVTAAITRTFDIADLPYAAVALPDSGLGAGVRWVNARGDVAGWVRGVGGHVRAAVWSGGTLRVLPLPDTLDAVARRVNAAGDVLVQPTRWPFQPLVYRGDGVLVTIRGLGGAGQPFPYDLNERRQVLTTTSTVSGVDDVGKSAAVVDVVTGAVVDSALGAHFELLNDAGQLAGYVTSGGGYPYVSADVATRGLPVPPRPTAGVQASICDPHGGRYTTRTPVDLADDGTLLVDECGALSLHTVGGQNVWVDRRVGQGQAHLSKQGGLVASLDTAGTIFLWRVGTTRTSRVRLPDGAWRVDSLAAINASGALAVHAVETGTGRGAALLLTPIAR